MTMVTKLGRSARGREILCMVCRYYLSNRTAEQVYMITYLQKVELYDPKKGNLEKFQNDWDFVRAGIAEEVPEPMAELIYYEAFQHHEDLKVNIDWYDRLEDEERMSFCVRICQAAEDAAIKKVQAKKKKARKEGGDDAVPEDDPDRMAV